LQARQEQIRGDGQRTLEGPVQLVFPNITPDQAALKLTIAQYLTPNDVSIQGVGITPDVELDPMTIDPLEMDVLLTGKGMREGDLNRHLSNARAEEGQKPVQTVRYHLPVAEREAWRERGGDPDDAFEMDFPIRFGRDLVLHLPAATARLDALRSAKDFIQNEQKNENGKVTAELSKLGIDWSEAPANAVPASKKDFEVAIDTDRPDNELVAGGSITLRVALKNNGKAPVYQLRGITRSDNPYFDNKELIFGKVDAGKSKTATAFLGRCDYEGYKFGSTAGIPKNAKRVCTVPKDIFTRSDGIRVEFQLPAGEAPSPPEVHDGPRASTPRVAHAYQLVDNGAAA
jgi:carboxyl-terminal processing protease